MSRGVAASNPWLQPETETTGASPKVEPASLAAELEAPVLTGAAMPQPHAGVPTPTGATPPVTFRVNAAELPGRLWVAGVHGGAGETTVATLFEGTPTEHQWPDATDFEPASQPNVGPPRLLLVARTSAAGLTRLQQVAAWWAAGELPPVDLVGVVLVADAPGRLPVALAQLAQLVAGGLPHTWTLDWHEEIRLGTPELTDSRRIRKTRREINALVAAAQTTPPSPQPRSER